MNRHVSVSVLLAAAVMAAAAGAVGLMLKFRSSPPQRRPTRVIPRVLAPPITAKRNYVVRIVGYGSVRPAVEVEITPQVSGRVIWKSARYLSGKFVTAGEVLYRIDQTDYRQARDAAEAEIAVLAAKLEYLARQEASLKASERIERERLALAERTYGRALALLKRGAGTENEVDSAREQVLTRRQQLQNILNSLAVIGPQRDQLSAEKRRAEVDRARALTALKRAEVRSPVAGRVLSCEVEVGDYVTAGRASGSIYGTEVMEIPVSVPASDLQWLDRAVLDACCRRGAAAGEAGLIPAEVRWREPGTGRLFTWPGRVDRLEAGLEAQTRTAKLIVRVVNRATGSATAPSADAAGVMPLDVNMFCEVIVQGRRLPRAFVLPRRAVTPERTVFVVENGRLAQAPVRVARFADDQALILPGGGIREAQRVVIGPIARPVLGMTVRAVDSHSAASMPSSMPAGTKGE